MYTSYDDSQVNLSALEGCSLHIAHSTKELSRMEVWVMKEYGVQESWTKIFRCSLIDQLQDICGIRLCAYSEDVQEILAALQAADTHKTSFVRCNLKQQEMNISGKIIGLPFDLEYNILSRVPLKHLYSLKRVYKHWHDLISSQYFLKLHRQQHASSNSDGSILIFSIITGSLLSYDFRADILTDLTSYTSKVPYFNIHSLVASCNGLLCLKDYDDFTLMYNPLTGANKKITLYVETCFKRIDSWTSYPRSTKLLGFGYDCFSDDYKLLSIHKIWLDDGPQTTTLIEEGAHLYSFKTDSWKVVNNKLIYRVLSQDKKTSDDGMVLTNNALHWLVVSSSQEECDHHKFVIGSFDLRMEEYSEIQPPAVGLSNIDVDRMTLSALDNCLHISHSTEDLSRMEVWVMKEYGVEESWIKVFHCSLIDELQGISGIPSPCAYSEDGQEILIALTGSTETFVRCNLQRQQVSIVEFLPSDQQNLTILPWKGFLGSPIDDD